MKSKGHRVTSLIMAIIIIVASALSTFFNTNYKWEELPAIIFAYGFGYMLPDTDLYINFLKHRSIVTHSAFIPICFVVLFPYLPVGIFCLIIGPHLLFDVPELQLKFKPLIGFGRVHGFGKEMGSGKSKWFLFTNSLICFGLGIALTWFRFWEGGLF